MVIKIGIMTILAMVSEFGILNTVTARDSGAHDRK
jgi:hypothetical protein